MNWPNKDKKTASLPVPTSRPQPKPVTVPSQSWQQVTPPAQAQPGRGYVAGRSVEVLSKRSERSQTFDNPDGTHSIELFSQPVFIRRGNSYVPLDTHLKKVGTRETTTASAAPLSLAASASDPVLASLSTPSSGNLSFALRGAKPVAGIDKSVEMIYPGVLPNVDLVLRPTPNGVKESLILKSLSAPTQFAFDLTPPTGTTPLVNTRGAVDFVNAVGVVVASIPAGYMFDSSKGPLSGLSAGSDNVQYALSPIAGTALWTLTVMVDKDWLAAAGRKFPVTIDPSVIAFGGPDDTWIQQNASGNHSRAGQDPNLPGGFQYLAVGPVPPDQGDGEATISLLHIDLSSLAGQTISSAELKLGEVWSSSCTPTEVDVQAVAGGTANAWNGDTVTWMNQPALNPTVLSRVTTALGWSASCPANVVHFPISAATVAGWVSNPSSYNGLAITYPTGADYLSWKKFDSYDAPVSTNTPRLVVTYGSAENANYNATSLTPPTATATGSVSVDVANTGSGSWAAGAGYKLGYKIMQGSTPVAGVTTSPVNVTAAPGATAHVTLPLPALPHGRYTIQLDMQRPDGTPFSSADGTPIGLVDFTVSSTPPVIASYAPPSGTRSTLTPTLSVTATDADDAISSLQYRFRICPTMASSVTCHDSGWTTSTAWQVNPGWMSWGVASYWSVSVQDPTGASATVTNISITAVVTQPLIGNKFGTQTSSKDAPGLDAESGNYTRVFTDLTVAGVGPDVSVRRTYNSQNPVVGAFGTGWSTPIDEHLTVDSDGTNNVVLSRGDGSRIRFGYVSGSPSYIAPLGSPDKLVSISGGGWTYRTTDGSTTSFDSTGSMSLMKDAAGHQVTFTRTSGHITAVTNNISGRKVTYGWTGAQVTSVTSDPVGGAPLTWTYAYTGNNLTSVCAPGLVCSTLTYTSIPSFFSATVDGEPLLFLRLNATDLHPASTTLAALATSTSRPGVSFITADSPVIGSPASTAKYDGSSGYQTVAPNPLGGNQTRSVQIWFKTATAGTILSGQDQTVGNVPTSVDPVLYVGTDAKLHGTLRQASPSLSNPVISSTTTVTDNTWHLAALVSGANQQILYLDGSQVGTLTGASDTSNAAFTTIGAGTAGTVTAAPTGQGYFNGSVADAAFYSYPLTADQVASLWNARNPAPVLTKISSPEANRTLVALTYDAETSRVKTLTDHDGTTWTSAVPQTGTTTIPFEKVVVTSDATAPARSLSYLFDETNHHVLRQRSTSEGENDSYTFGTDGRLATATNGDGDITSYTYDANGNATTTTVANPVSPATPNSFTTLATYFTSPNQLDPRNGAVLSTADGRAAAGSGVGTAGNYVAITPVRLVDTRAVSPVGGYNTPQPGSLTWRPYAARNMGTIPSDAAALMVAVTAVSAPNGGWLQLAPNTNRPIAQTTFLTYETGDTIANTGIVELGTDGMFAVRSLQSLDLIVDVEGYFTKGNGSPAPGGFVPVSNFRVADTRNGTGGTTGPVSAGSLSTFTLVGNGGIPASATSAFVAITIINPAGRGSIAPWNSGTAAPGCTLSFDPTITQTYTTPVNLSSSGQFTLYVVGSATQFTVDIEGYFDGEALSSGYTPVTARLFSTQGQPNGFVGGTVQQVQIAGVGGIPAVGASLAGVMLNMQSLIRSGSSGSGYFKVWPSDGVEPSVSNGVTYSTGDVTASNTIIVRPGADGKVNIRNVGPNTANPDLTIDAQGYFTNTPDIYSVKNTLDAVGDILTVTYPLPNGQAANPVVTNTYSNGTESAYDTGTVPAYLLLKTVGARGQITTYQYLHNGDLARVTSPSGLITNFTYDAIGRRASISVSPGGTSTYTYDGLGRPLTTTYPATTNTVTGSGHQRRTTTTYDADGNPLSVSDSDLVGGDSTRTTTWTYDSHDRIATTTDPAGRRTTSTYTNGDLTSAVTADGLTTTMSTYDGRHLLTKTQLSGANVDPTNAANTTMVTATYQYDAAERMVNSSDAAGNVRTYSYNSLGEKTAVVGKAIKNAAGVGHDITVEQDTYNAAGWVGSRTQNGLTTTDTYDNAGNLLSQSIDPATLNRVTTYSYDLDSHPLTATETGAAQPGRTETSTYTYDSAGQWLSKTVNGDGSARYTTTTTRDARELALTVSDPTNAVTSYGYDSLGQSTTVTQPSVSTFKDGVSSTVTPTTMAGYDTFGDRTQVKDPNGNTTSTTYNADGQETGTTSPAYTPVGSSTPIIATVNTSYDNNGRVNKITDPLTRNTTFTYAPQGWPTTRTDPPVGANPAGVWTNGYDKVGNTTSTITAIGATTQATYDGLGRALTTTEVERATTVGAVALPLTNYTTTNTYDDAGHLVTQASPENKSTSYTYDAAGDLLSVTDPASHAWTVTYDNVGRPLTATNPDGIAVTASYDLAGREIISTKAHGSSTQSNQTTYDDDGRPTIVTTPAGRTTGRSYNARGDLTAVTDHPTGTTPITVGYTYDPAGNRTSSTDGNNNVTTTSYTSWNEPEKVTEPATTQTPTDRVFATTYNALGQVASTSAPGAITTVNTYDALGNLTGQTGTGATAVTSARTFVYDAASRLSSFTAGAGTQTVAWYDRGLLKSSAGPAGSTTEIYNGDDTINQQTTAAGTSTYTYDAADRLNSVTDPLTGANLTTSYTPAGLPTGYLSNSPTGSSLIYGYDSLDRLSTITGKVNTTTTASAAYGYDADDNLISKTELGTSSTYTYDGANRLTSSKAGTAATVNYGFDLAGNRTTAGNTTFTYNQRNQLISDSTGASYTYSPSGQRTSIVNGGVTTTSTYNAYDQLITEGSTSYGYDAQDRLLTSGTSGTALNYLGLSDQVVSAATDKVTYLPDGTPLAAATGGISSLLVTNGHQDVFTGFTTAGTVGFTRSYDPWGKVTAATGTGGAIIGYQSGYTQATTGQVATASRWYDPSTGQFISRDTVTNLTPPTAGTNQYGYGLANPLAYTDPSGHSVCDVFCPPLRLPAPFDPDPTPAQQVQKGNSQAAIQDEERAGRAGCVLFAPDCGFVQAGTQFLAGVTFVAGLIQKSSQPSRGSFSRGSGESSLQGSSQPYYNHDFDVDDGGQNLYGTCAEFDDCSSSTAGGSNLYGTCSEFGDCVRPASTPASSGSGAPAGGPGTISVTGDDGSGGPGPDTGGGDWSGPDGNTERSSADQQSQRRQAERVHLISNLYIALNFGDPVSTPPAAISNVPKFVRADATLQVVSSTAGKPPTTSTAAASCSPADCEAEQPAAAAGGGGGGNKLPPGPPGVGAADPGPDKNDGDGDQNQEDDADASAKGLPGLTARTSSLRHTFSQHARDFGFTGSWNKTTGELFEKTLSDQLGAPGTLRIVGTYRGNIPVIHNVNATSGLNVIQNLDGSLVGAWRLNPQQLWNVLTRGSL